MDSSKVFLIVNAPFRDSQKTVIKLGKHLIFNIPHYCIVSC